MMTTKPYGIFLMLFIAMFSLSAFAQDAPSHIVISKYHWDLSSDGNPADWQKGEKEYFDKVISKNEFIMGSDVLAHYYTPDNSEVLFVALYKSWEDIEKADERSAELEKLAWPDSAKRVEGRQKAQSYYTRMHSDEIMTPILMAKVLPMDTVSRVFYVRTSHFAFPKDGKNSEIRDAMNEYHNNITLKNTLLRGYYPMRHLYGADGRDFVEVFVYDSLSDLEKAAEENGKLVTAHWPDSKARNAFFDKMDKYIEPWHGDAIYRNISGLRK
jgi:hypothetical protein